MVDACVTQCDGHLVAIHRFVINSLEVIGHTHVFGNLLIGPVPGRSGRFGLLGSVQLAGVEGTGQHGDELNAGDLLIGSERAVLEAGHDAQLGALGHVVVVPGGALHVGEAGHKSQVLVDEGVVNVVLNVVGVIVDRRRIDGGFAVSPVGSVVEPHDVVISVNVADDLGAIAAAADGVGPVGDVGVGRKRGSNHGEAHDQGQEQGDKAGLGAHSDWSFLSNLNGTAWGVVLPFPPPQASRRDNTSGAGHKIPTPLEAAHTYFPPCKIGGKLVI